MQLSKGFNFEDHSIFNDHNIHDQTFIRSSPLSKQEQYQPSTALHEEDARKIQTSSKQLRFFQEFKKIYNVSYHLYLEKMRIAELWKQAMRRLTSIEDRLKSMQERESKKVDLSSQQNKTKRARRTAQMIQKKFRCDVPFCERLYGSEGSLQQHIKLKHPELYRPSDHVSQVFSEDVNDSI